jgi:hypothetical protein
VTSVNAAGESETSNEAVATVSDLSVWLEFNETSGTLASDSTGNGWNGTLVNGPVWDIGRVENAIALDGSNDYVTLPNGVVSGLTDFTITTWLYLDANSDWARVFDFGSGTATNMFLTPQNGANDRLRFAIRTGGGAEQQINSVAIIPLQTWTHLAVTWTGNLAILYVNGVEVGRNSSMTLNPSSLGSTTQNFIGKSQYADPYLDGKVDDFRILNRALSPHELLAMVSLPNLYGDYNRDHAINAADYTLWRNSLNTSVPAFSGADGDGDGFIDRDDFALWKANFGASIATGAITPHIPAETADQASDAAFAVYLPLAPFAAAAPAAERMSGQEANPREYSLWEFLPVSNHRQFQGTRDARLRHQASSAELLELVLADDQQDDNTARSSKLSSTSKLWERASDGDHSPRRADDASSAKQLGRRRNVSLPHFPYRARVGLDETFGQ